MSEKNLKEEKKENTDTGSDSEKDQPKITAQQLLMAHEAEIQKIAAVLDILYLQLATVIEVMAEKKIIDPDKWSEKLNSVGKQIEERMLEDQKKKESKIVIPEKKIILPGEK